MSGRARHRERERERERENDVDDDEEEEEGDESEQKGDESRFSFFPQYDNVNSILFCATQLCHLANRIKRAWEKGGGWNLSRLLGKKGTRK